MATMQILGETVSCLFCGRKKKTSAMLVLILIHMFMVSFLLGPIFMFFFTASAMECPMDLCWEWDMNGIPLVLDSYGSHA